jgi:hypothetical protein
MTIHRLEVLRGLGFAKAAAFRDFDAHAVDLPFVKPNLAASEIRRTLRDGNINVRSSTHWMRVSPSVVNDARHRAAPRRRLSTIAS